MNWIQTIVYNIAKKLGLSLSVKPLITDDYSNTQSISLTATIANKVSTLTLMDSSISIKGDSLRAEYLRDIWQDVLIDALDKAAEVALGTGDGILKPYTDGERIGIDIIKGSDFYVCSSIGNFIKSCIFRCETIKKQDGNVFERFEVHRLRDIDIDGVIYPATIIHQLVFRNGKEVELSSVPEWSGLEETTVIAGVDHLLFGRIKSPTVNREYVNSVTGVPITDGLDDVMKNAVDAYNRFNDEFARKETMIFADKTLFTRNKETGKTEIPSGKRRLFMLFPRQPNATETLIDTYSPDIRHESLVEGIEQNFKMLELLAGLSNGILTAPTTNFATATEIRASLSQTFAYMTKYRRSIEKAIYQVIDSIDILCNANELTPYGSYSLSVEWSSAYIENLTEQFARLVEAYKMGVVSLAEVRAWLMDETEQVAAEKIQLIEDMQLRAKLPALPAATAVQGAS